MSSPTHARTVLVLAASRGDGQGGQMVGKFLAAARSRGLRIAVMDDPQYLERAVSLRSAVDEVIALNIDDLTAVASWASDARRARTDIVVVLSGREFAQPAVSIIAQTLGVRGNSRSAATTAWMKDLSRAALAKAGLSQPEFALCADPGALRAFIDRSVGPWVLKPRDASGSRGVRRIENVAAVEAYCASMRPTWPLLIEEFVEGREFSAEGIFVDGTPRVLAITEKLLKGFVEVGHVLPAELDSSVREAMAREVRCGLSAVGLSVGAFHVELWSTARGIVLGEIHARLGGAGIHLLLEHAFGGFDVFGAVLDDSLGRPVQLPAAPSAGAAVRFLEPRAGIIERVDGLEDIRSAADVLAFHADLQPNARLPELRDAGDRRASVIVGAATSRAARARAEALLAAIQITYALDRGAM